MRIINNENLLRMRGQMQKDLARRRHMPDLVPDDYRCPDCGEPLYNLAVADPSQYMHYLVQRCPWCSYDLKLPRTAKRKK